MTTVHSLNVRRIAAVTAVMLALAASAVAQEKKPRPFWGAIHLQLGYLEAGDEAKQHFEESLQGLEWIDFINLRPDPAFPTVRIKTKNDSNPDVVDLLERLRKRGIGVTGIRLNRFAAMKWVTQLGHMCGVGTLKKGIKPAEGCPRCRDTALSQLKGLEAFKAPSRFTKLHRILTEPPRADIVDVGAYLDSLAAAGKPAVSLLVLPKDGPVPEKSVRPIAGLEPSKRKTGGSPTDPLVTMTLGHACCNRCAAALYHALNSLPWAVETRVADDWSYPRASVRVKPGEAFDLADLHDALRRDGMTAPKVRLANLNTVELRVGFAYLPGLVKGGLPKGAPARRALERAMDSLAWAAKSYRIQGATVTIKLRHADEARPEELVSALSRAGFPPKSLRVTPGS